VLGVVPKVQGRLAPGVLVPQDAQRGGAQEEEPIDDALIRPDGSVKEIPAFENFAIVNDDQYGAALGDEKAPVAEFEFNSVAAETLQDPSASFADLNEEFEHGSAEPAAAPFAQFETSAGSEVDFSGAIFNSSAGAGSSADDGSEADRRAAMLKQELESVDFYISQGYTDIALDTLEMLERQFTSHPDIESRRSKLSEMGVTAAPASTQKSAEEFVGNEITWDAPVAADPEPDIVAMMMPEGTMQEAAQSSNGNGPATRPAIDAGLADIFEEFRVAAENEEDDPAEDYETHYNMGLAYKEMDLLDEAVREFQTAVGLTMPKDGTSRFLSCCNMLGHCFVQKNLPKAAVLWFKKGLEAPGHSEEEYQALRYELAAAFEQMGDLSQAVDMFTEIYSVDVSYRDVSERLHELQAKKLAVK